MTATKPTGRMSLRNILFANAVFSLMSAAVLIAAAGPLSDFLGAPPLVLVVGGVALLVWAAFAFVNTRREIPSRRNTRLVIAGDLTWVVGAVVIILLPDTLTTSGKWALVTVSVFVLDFAVFQWRAVRCGW